ncbi:protein kinase domain-containing protein [Nannocystaceae bacterium ST9]
MSTLEPGTIVGRFVVLAKLGEGGVGVVHLAYDPKLDRRIALKFLHERSAEQTTRLLREAQALGRLAHPNVVAVHDVGSLDDRVWVAMEYVQGQTLAEWLGPGPDTRPWREVVEVLQAAGRGVVAAHAAGMVHRDLKPSNFMIGDEGRVRVMDFGLVRSESGDSSARELETPDGADMNATLTRSGALVGTPAYMAPEQFLAREVDARSDQFSFCAVAWRALYGERPFAGESLDELRYSVIHGRRRPPPSGSEVPTWLRDVVVRGLEVDPDRRWASMQALLDAMASGRRRAGLRRLGSVVAGLALLGVGVFGFLRWDRAREVAEITAACELEGQALDEIWNDDTRELVAQSVAASGSPLAEHAGPNIRARLDEYAREWAESSVQVCLDSELEGTRSRESAALARDCFTEQRATLAELVEFLVGVDRSGVDIALTTIHRLEPAANCLDEHALGRRIPAPEEPELRGQVEALRVRIAKLDARMHMQVVDDASGEALAIYADAQALGWPPLEAEAGFRAAVAKARMSEDESAAELFERTFFLAAEHGNDVLAVDTASYLVFSAYERGDYQEGLRWGRVGQMIVARSEVGIELAEGHLLHAIASVFEGLGKFEESVATFERVLAIYERELPRDHPELSTVLISICVAESKLGQVEAAIAHCQRALDLINAEIPGPSEPRAQVLNTMGSAYLDNGDPERALPYLFESLEAAELTMPPDHPDLGMAYYNIGLSYLELGDPTKGLVEFDRTLDLWAKVLPPDHPMTAYPLEGKGRALTELARASEAIPIFEQALALRTGEDTDPVRRGMTQYYLARALAIDPATRARALELGREGLASLHKGEGADEELAEVQAWLSEQGG